MKRSPRRPGSALLPSSLRTLVKKSVALLGDVIRDEAGDAAFERIEMLRREMAALRGVSSDSAHRTLNRVYAKMEGLTPTERMKVAEAFTLMLEVMNACENSYRDFRLRSALPGKPQSGPEAIVYVFTAHPTESRSASNSAIFRQIQAVMVDAYLGDFEKVRPALEHLFRLAWRVQVAPESRPTVGDEADYLYSIVLREEILRHLTDPELQTLPVYFRSWVGGDKDGHPGVDAKAFADSLMASRRRLIEFVRHLLEGAEQTLRWLNRPELDAKREKVLKALAKLEALKTGDGARVKTLRREVRAFANAYRTVVGAEHPELVRIDRLLRLFPGMVVPLEFRESSDVLMSSVDGHGLAITEMLRALERYSRGGDPRWYVRGFVISMAGMVAHLKRAARFMKLTLGGARVPIVPLLEQGEALKAGPSLVRAMLRDPVIAAAVEKWWGNKIEVMVGYSDSAKEMGVLPSRVAIADGLTHLEREMASSGVQLVFFHGSGGSVDRGGGSVQEQMSWWPKSSLKLFKATIQGEMVDRSMASAEIASRQWERIGESAADLLRQTHPLERAPAVRALAARVEREYRRKVASPGFLDLIEHATPYPYLSLLRIGSRPSKRAGGPPSVSSLRAIPWVLCWTQTRVLFPTWWGVGTAWKSADSTQKRLLKQEFRRDPLFSTYVRALGFTLAKVELPVFRLYVERSGLSAEQVRAVMKEFEHEYALAIAFVRALSGKRDLLWFRPWLGQSIALRSPMIHPLNVLQRIAIEKKEDRLLRVTVTGIASGLMTTG